MTAQEFRSALALLGLSQLGAARLFKVNGRTVRRWVSGEQEIPEAAAIALRLMIKHNENPEDWNDGKARSDQQSTGSRT